MRKASAWAGVSWPVCSLMRVTRDWAAAGARFSEIAALARILTGRDDEAVRARLNASVARLYQLERDELEHVLGTFPLVPIDERRGVLRAFDECR